MFYHLFFQMDSENGENNDLTQGKYVSEDLIWQMCEKKLNVSHLNQKNLVSKKMQDG